MKRIKDKKDKWSIFEFLFLAIIIPLICIGIKKYTSALNNAILDLILFGIQGMAPALAAFITVFNNYSLKGLKNFLKEKYFVNISYKYCLIGFLIPMGLLIFSKIIITVYKNENFELFIPNAAKFLIIFWALAAEELGWRGFLQERVEQKIGIIFTPLVVGVIWGLWYYHYFLSGVTDVPFTLLILGCIFESYGYFVITKLAKGNILPASIWHFSGNLFLNIFSLNINDGDGKYLTYMITTFSYVFCVIGFFIYYYRYKKHCNNKNDDIRTHCI
jgi:membrane protease YdiL (CAAX protease family)